MGGHWNFQNTSFHLVLAPPGLKGGRSEAAFLGSAVRSRTLTEVNSSQVSTQTSKTKAPRRQWLTPIILGIQQTEIRKIMVPSQPQANSLEDPILKKIHHTKNGLVEWLKW
jgi:hypothetical protein